MYIEGRVQKKKKRGWIWLLLITILLLCLLGWAGFVYLKSTLKTETKITQSKAVVSKLGDTSNRMQKYDLPDFSIELPLSWKMVPRDEGAFQTFTWTTSEKGTNGEKIQIFEDTIPTNLAVNRALVVVGEGDHVTRTGEASDNCIAYTRNQAADTNNVGAVARWQGVDFRCDTSNMQRNVVGTSSTDGINTVILRSPRSGAQHKFFFVYTSQDLNPDYSVFYSALASLKMQ